jgi:hypothetical protein
MCGPTPAGKYSHPMDKDPAWRAMEKRAMREAREQLDRTPAAKLDPGNPNHPSHDGIFGYDRAAFMAKQYR